VRKCDTIAMTNCPPQAANRVDILRNRPLRTRVIACRKGSMFYTAQRPRTQEESGALAQERVFTQIIPG